MSTTTTRTRPSIWTELHREWAWLVTRPAARSAVVDWSTSHPVFSDAETIQDIADIVSRSSGPAIRALLAEHHAGHPLAARVLTQCMLPKLIRSARYARTTVHERGESNFDERAQQTLGAFQDVLDEWRPGASATAGSLGLNTLNKITQMRTVPSQVPVEPDSQTFERANNMRSDMDSVDAQSLLEWSAVNHVLGEAERDIIDRAYINPKGTLKTLAVEIGVSDAALRQRLSRTISKLRSAVLTSIKEDSFDAWNGDTRTIMAA